MRERMELYRSAFEEYIHGKYGEWLSSDAPFGRLLESMGYSLFAGGKRIRPILVLEFCRVCGGDWHDALPAAAAIEMIHTYSLIHDDLPCMDNDDYRRGKPTNHKVFGEATAVLAGDALLTEAFRAACEAPNAANIVSTLSYYAGPYGMVGGQQMDLEGENKICTEDEILTINQLKTSGLLMAACSMGVLAANGSSDQLQSAASYGSCVGRAFQLRDDILDVIGDSKKMGKNTGMDVNKNTLVKLYGIDVCEEKIRNETEQAIRALASFEDTLFLKDLANMLAGRDY